MINAAKIVLHEGIVPLSRVFKSVFPNATYHSGNAKRRLLQMPLVAMHIQNELFLIEKIKGLEYSLLASIHFYMENSPSLKNGKGSPRRSLNNC